MESQQRRRVVMCSLTSYSTERDVKGEAMLMQPVGDSTQYRRKREPAGLKPLAKDVVTYGFGLIMARGVLILLTPILARTLTVEEFGSLAVLQVSATLLAMVSSLYMDSGLLRYYGENTGRASLLAAHLTLILGISSAVVTAGFLVSNRVVDALPGYTGSVAAVRAAFLTIPGVLVLQHLLSIFQAQRLPRRLVTILVCNAVLVVGITLYLVVLEGQGIAGVFIARILGDCVTILISYTVFRLPYAFVGLEKWAWKLLRFGIPLVPEILCSFLLSHITKFILAGATSVSMVGLLTVADRVSMLIGFGVSAFRTAWLPYAYSVMGSDRAQETYAKVLNLYLRIALAVTVALVGLSAEIVLLFAGPLYLPASKLLGLMSGDVLMGAAVILNIGILIREKPWLYSLAAIAAALLHTCAAFVLINRWQLLGAAMASFLGHTALVLMVFFLSQRVYKMPYNIGAFWGYVGGVIVLVLLNWSILDSLPFLVRLIGVFLIGGVLLKDIVLSPQWQRILQASR